MACTSKLFALGYFLETAGTDCFNTGFPQFPSPLLQMRYTALGENGYGHILKGGGEYLWRKEDAKEREEKKEGSGNMYMTSAIQVESRKKHYIFVRSQSKFGEINYLLFILIIL